MYLLVIFYPQSVTDSYFQADIYKKHCRAKRKKQTASQENGRKRIRWSVVEEYCLWIAGIRSGSIFTLQYEAHDSIEECSSPCSEISVQRASMQRTSMQRASMQRASVQRLPHSFFRRPEPLLLPNPTLWGGHRPRRCAVRGRSAMRRSVKSVVWLSMRSRDFHETTTEYHWLFHNILENSLTFGNYRGFPVLLAKFLRFEKERTAGQALLFPNWFSELFFQT